LDLDVCAHTSAWLRVCRPFSQVDNEGLNSRLQKTLEDLACKENQLRCKLNANELQLKEQIVYNVSGSGKPGVAGVVADMAGTA
jgi:hypothetical protein